MTACGSRENCSNDCSEEMESRMSNILRQIADERLNTWLSKNPRKISKVLFVYRTSTCKAACCLDNECNSVSVKEIKTSGRLVSKNDDVKDDVDDDVDDDVKLDVGNVLSSAVTAIGDLVSGSLRNESPQIFENFSIFFGNLICLFSYYLMFCWKFNF